MGINWGSLAAGFADGYSAYETDKRERARDREDFEAKQEILDEYQKRGEERRAAREGAQRREKEKEFITQQTAFLKSIGLSDEAVSQVMSSGKAGLEFHTELIGNAMAKGYDPNELYRLPSVKPEDPRTVAKVLDEMPDVYADKDKMALDTGRVDGMQETTAPGFNLQRYRDIMGPEKKYASSLDARFAVITQKKIGASPEELAQLNAEEQELLSAMAREAAAKRKPESGEETDMFSKTSVESALKSRLRQGLQAEGFTVDLEGNIQGALEGREMQYANGMIRAAESMRMSYSDYNDRTMNNTINSLVTQAQDSYRNVAARKLREARESNLPLTPVAKEQALQQAKQGEYRPGDVVVIKTKEGAMVTTIYTGVRNPLTGVPFAYAD